MPARRFALSLALSALACLPLAVHAQAADKATTNALEGDFDFADANAGTILPEQIPAEGYKKFHVLDVRDAAQAAMALRMDGFENVRLLYGGFNEWKARGGMEAQARASKKS